jgi:hypothetical protein
MSDSKLYKVKHVITQNTALKATFSPLTQSSIHAITTPHKHTSNTDVCFQLRHKIHASLHTDVILQPTVEYSCIWEETFDVRTPNIISQVKGKVQWHLICEVYNTTTIWEFQINYYAYEQFITHCRLTH